MDKEGTAVNKVGQAKEKDFDEIMPRDGFCDMPEETQKIVVDLCREAYKQHYSGEFKYYKGMACFIKEQLDKQLKPSWHIIVGTNFGSFATYETQSIYLFWLEHIGFLVWKHG